MTERFHKAARDGYLDALKEATRKDCNSRDEDGMTPTLWAAFEGNLDALRLLVGRGGKPEEHDNYGNTALHLASAKGHLNCVTFLINFGVNIWELDIDLHSAKDLAAINNREDILKYLDSITAQQEAIDPKLAKSLQKKAKKNAEENKKNFARVQAKQDKIAKKENEKMEKRRASLHPAALGVVENFSTDRRQSLGPSAFSSIAGSHPGSGGTVKYSDLMGTVTSRAKGTMFSRGKKDKGVRSEDIFTVSGGTQRGLRSGHQADIVFRDKEVTTGDTGDREEERESDTYLVEPSSIFNRPGFGSVAFRHSISAFNALSVRDEDEYKDDSIGSAGSLANRSNKSQERRQRQQIWEEEEDELSDELSDDESDYTSLHMFLAAHGLMDWAGKLTKERIDLDALMLLSEADLSDSLSMPLGPRKKLMKAVADRRRDMEDPDELTDTQF